MVWEMSRDEGECGSGLLAPAREAIWGSSTPAPKAAPPFPLALSPPPSPAPAVGSHHFLCERLAYPDCIMC